ncbi:MAG TPA: hypothetical protein VJG90_07250 [Candidatus Nanoarchaeia archaeon]|nr:hypothetical protein [Candidatus Nanoarchaeia archaeon]
MMCNKCMGFCGWLTLIIGVLFLLRDFNVWNFWNIQWWTVMFIFMGLCHLGMRSCPDCCKAAGRKR